MMVLYFYLPIMFYIIRAFISHSVFQRWCNSKYQTPKMTKEKHINTSQILTGSFTGGIFALHRFWLLYVSQKLLGRFRAVLLLNVFMQPTVWSLPGSPDVAGGSKDQQSWHYWLQDGYVPPLHSACPTLWMCQTILVPECVWAHGCVWAKERSTYIMSLRKSLYGNMLFHFLWASCS